MKYEKFIKEINDRSKMKQINFYIKNYPHYKDCSIVKWKIDGMITCILTKDLSEDVSFYGEFEENCKLFNFGSKGKYTLKDIWNSIVITKIVYFE